jgi:hypothetical protein
MSRTMKIHGRQAPRSESVQSTHILARRQFMATQKELAAIFGVSKTRQGPTGASTCIQLEHSALQLLMPRDMAKLRRAIVREAKLAGVSVEAWLGE